MAKTKRAKKETKDIQFSGTLPKELMEKVDAEAKKTDRSRAAVIRIAVGFFLDKYGAPSVTVS